ncbi:PREDICTED: endothelin-converting enzyme 2-like [Priapulus caudatus]|uniref:Endothelin-converting enzyme 2-like n=1 Tax=Priapulus caudatus TaxID=37621 RepID=A0ABM1DTU6_PRICU|nr:PREDICTED: endothelin-converting enzyme 2-like [Priapulus caudatus]
MADTEEILRESPKYNMFSRSSLGNNTVMLAAVAGVCFVTFLCIIIGLSVALANASTDDATSVDYEECVNADCLMQAAHMVGYINASVDPCNSFYEYACGSYADRHPLPADRRFVNVRANMESKIADDLKLILESPVKDANFETEWKVKTMFTSCMNDYESMKSGAGTFLGADGIINKTGGWAVLAPLEDWDLDNALQRLHVDHWTNVFFRFQVVPDEQDSKKNRILVRLLLLYISTILFCKCYLTMTTTINWNNYMTINQLTSAVPSINWIAFFKRIFDDLVDGNTIIYEYRKDYLKGMADIIASLNESTVNNYMEWHLIWRYTAFISYEYAHIERVFNEQKLNVHEPKPQWTTCYELVDQNLRDGLGALFIRDHFYLESKTEVSEIYERIRGTLIKYVESETKWMKADEKKTALNKLTALTTKLGFTAFYIDNSKMDAFYDSLKVVHNAILDNVISLDKWLREETKDLYQYGEQTDQWLGHLYHVYGMYIAMWNQLEVTAGLMQHPYYDKLLPPYVNYGSIGSLLATHTIQAIDETGSKWQADGSMKDWWSEDTRTAYLAREKCVSDRFINATFNIPPYGDVAVRPAPWIINEIIAFMEGVRITYKTFTDYPEIGDLYRLPGINLSNDQVVFLSYAQTMCSHRDPHDLYFSLFRGAMPDAMFVDNVLMQVSEFSRAFNCPVGSTMNPKNKCRVIT